MGVSYEYDTTIDELIKDLKKLRKEYGGGKCVSLSNPGFYDPYFDGRDCRIKPVVRDDKVILKEWSSRWDVG